MSEQISRRARSRRNPYGELIHLLNQRYHREWERAEALENELAAVRRWKLWPMIAWLRRIRRRFRTLSEPAIVENAIPYSLPIATTKPTARISIIIPFKDRVELLRNCLRSLTASAYRRFEIILINNGSVEHRAERFLLRMAARSRIRIVDVPGEFNFSRLCNVGAAQATGDQLLFLNNDTEVLERDWLEQLLRIAGDPQVGIVGATLLYPDRTIQHAGLFPRSDGLWVHPYRGRPENEPGDNGELRSARSVPAVTAACLLIGRELFQALDGFDERFAVAYNDVDLCTRVRNRGLLVVVTPDARLLHYEGMSRGYMVDELVRTC